MDVRTDFDRTVTRGLFAIGMILDGCTMLHHSDAKGSQGMIISAEIIQIIGRIGECGFLHKARGKRPFREYKLSFVQYHIKPARVRKGQFCAGPPIYNLQAPRRLRRRGSRLAGARRPARFKAGCFVDAGRQSTRQTWAGRHLGGPGLSSWALDQSSSQPPAG